MINQALTDSLTLTIPLNSCTVIDQRLTSLTYTYYEDLNAIDADPCPPKPIKVINNGKTVRFTLVNIPIYNKKTNEKIPTKFIQVTLTTKLLNDCYFDGINKQNIECIYNEFMAFEIFQCSIDTFLDGMAGDCDVCLNFYSESKAIYLDTLKVVKAQTGIKDKYTKLFSDANQIGMQFNTREGAKPSLPFIKMYHKELELLNRSAEFYNTYLYPKYGQAIKNLTRVEATIKNHDHKKRLEKFNILPKFRTLREYLEIPEQDLRKFIIFSLESYILTKPRIKAPELSPTDHIIYELIQNCIIQGYDHKSLLTIVETFTGSSSESTKVARSRMRTKITQLFDLLIHKDLKIKSKASYNAHVLTYLENIGIKI